MKALGLATGLSVSYLSQVERGISSVNVNSLRKIADALETTIDYFLEPPALHEKSVMRLHEQDVFTVDGSRFYYSRISNDTLNGRLLEPIVVSILPSDERERIEPACHAGEEFIYVLEGILTLFFNGEKILMYPGDSAHYDGAVPHEWGNFTAKMVRILAVNTPALFREK